jgi:phthiocerol/phenolphthiocerol synthesis type-I polyketide synthase E
LPHALRAGERAGWARFALPEELRSDRFGLHPALLDAATGVARVLGEGDYLPLEYRSIVVRGPLPPEIECRFRLSGGEKAGETLVCDVSILDGEGREVVAVSGYTMRRLSDEAVQGLAPKSAVVESPVPVSAGILPAEGGEVLARVLMRGLDSPQVLVSTRDFAAVAAQAHGLTAERLARLHSGATVHPRPQVQTPFEAPRSALEERLAGLFQEMLGVDRVGIHDNFFDLGGNSLVATQLISRLREQFDVGLTLRALFESPTVAELGVLVVQAQAEQVEEEDLAAALAELRGLSPEELAERLAEERARAGA